MLRKAAIVGSTVAFALAVFGTGTAHAAQTPVNASGSLNCTISGKVKVSPPLLFGATGAATFTAKIKSTTCSGTSGVSSVKGTLISVLPTADCTALALTGFPPASFAQKVKLKGAQKYAPTAWQFSAGGTFTTTNPITMNLPGTGSVTVSGSFAGQSPTMTFVYDQGVTEFAAGCTAKTKGLKGSGGLKKMSFAGASNLNVPA